MDLLSRPEAAEAVDELDVCAELGISPSAFRGRPSVEWRDYDDAGRVVKTVTRSPWTPEDRALMIARQIHHRSLCPGCGMPKDKAWHPENDGWIELAGVRECLGCQAMEMADWDGNDSNRPKAKKYPVLRDTRNYRDNPLPPLPPLRPRDGEPVSLHA